MSVGKEFARITKDLRALEVAEQMFDCIRDHERTAQLEKNQLGWPHETVSLTKK